MLILCCHLKGASDLLRVMDLLKWHNANVWDFTPNNSFPSAPKPPSKHFMADEDFLKLLCCLGKGLGSDGGVTVLNNASVEHTGHSFRYNSDLSGIIKDLINLEQAELLNYFKNFKGLRLRMLMAQVFFGCKVHSECDL